MRAGGKSTHVFLAAAVAVALGAAANTAAAAADDPPPTATALQQQAATLVGQGRYNGAEPLFARAVSLIEQQAGPDSPLLADPLGSLADVYEIEGRYDSAGELYRRVLAIREKAPGQDRLDLGGALNALAGLYKLEGRYADAEKLYRQALEIVEAAPAPPVFIRATVLSNLALVYQNEGRPDEAEPLYRRAVSVAAGEPEAERLLGPVILNNLAGLYKEQHRYAEAEPLYASVLKSRETGAAAPLDLAASLNNLASVYDAQSKEDEAEPLYRRALQLRETTLGADHPEVAQSLNNLAGIFWAKGDYAGAEPLLIPALAIRQKTLPPNHPETITALNNLAALYWSEARADDALDYSRRAIAALEAHLATIAGNDSPGAIAEIRKSRTYFANYIAIAYGAAAGRPERQAALAADTFRVVQMAEASDAAQSVAALAARLAAGSGALAAAIRSRQDLTRRVRQLDDAIVAAAAKPPATRDRDAEDALREQRDAARRELDRSDREIATQYPDYAAIAVPKPVPLADVQSALAADEALLVYLAAPKWTWFWVVRRDAAALYRADLGAAALAQEIATLREPLTPDLGPYPATKAFALYQQILAPALAQLGGAHHLIIVPDGALQSLPFSLLVTRKPKQDPTEPVDNRSIGWLVRDYATSVLPAVSSLRAFRQGRAPAAGRQPFLGIGDPLLASSAAGSAAALRGAGADEIRQLPALPETADELRAVARTLGASPDDLLLGRQATLADLRQMHLDRYRVIEFATHGLLSGELKNLTEPALVLTPPAKPDSEDDGLLRASAIALLKLDADWVVLSACNTAAADGTGADGWSGLANAFFYAGARSLLVSHWPVWSKATVKLIVGTFEQQRKEPAIGRAEALRRAELAMLDPDEPPEFAHPLAWAPFVLAGEGQPGR